MSDVDKKETKGTGITGIFIQTQLLTHQKAKNVVVYVGTMNLNDVDKKETKGITGIFIQTQLLTHYKAKNVVVYVGLINFTLSFHRRSFENIVTCMNKNK